MLLAAAFLALSQVPATAASPHQPHLLPLPDDAIAYVPASAPPHPPLLVLLHGAGRENAIMLQHFEAEADKRGIVLLAPASRGITWDTVAIAEEPPSSDSPLATKMAHRFSGSRDAKRVEDSIAALEKIVPIDAKRIVLSGFSDGATFALAMGMARAYPFAAVIAWSPGIAIQTAAPARGRRVFVSHGRSDPILRFETTCRDIVPLLQSEGANVTFLPFDGGHDAPVWLKDTFLDAVFGRVPHAQPVRGTGEHEAGTEARPLPTQVEKCAGAKAEVPKLPGQ